MVLRDLVRAKVVFLEHALGRLRRYRTWSVRRLQEDEDAQDIILHNLQVAIQCCVDLASHVVSDERWEIPANMADCFRVLAAHRVLPRPLSQRFGELARFRNQIVHEYAHLQLGKVHGALRRLSDFDRFRRHIARFAKLIR